MAARRTHGMIRRLAERTAASAPRPATEAVRAARESRVLPVVLAGVLAVLVVLSGFFGVRLYQQHGEEQRNQDILAAARQSAVNFTSLDYRHYDRDSKNVLKGATGDFKEQFTTQTKKLTKLVTDNKSVSEGHVLEAGIAKAGDTSAQVLVVADSKVTNVAAPQGQARNYRLQLDLVLEGGRWLTSNLEFVG
ncbi:hypothetical protein ACFWIY_22130 [Streptomyces sioyaensis]|uniref:hypothetical protein n=1 Tax=Streptomyces sioyaensis TaxID=67364 RepID=UPI003658F71B